MKLYFFKSILIISFFYSCAQKKDIYLKFTTDNESDFVKAYINNNSLFVITFETNKIKKNKHIYLYKINLKTKNIEHQTILEEGLRQKDIIIKEENDSLQIINYSTYEENAKSYIFSSDLKSHRFVSLPIVNFIDKYKLYYFLDFKHNQIYINSEPKDNFSYRHFLEENTLYLFENNPRNKYIRFSKFSSNSNYDKIYPYENQIGYENDFREYDKFRFNGDFLFSKNRIFVYPSVDDMLLQPLAAEKFFVLIFDKNNGSLIKIQKINLEKYSNCENLSILSDMQFTLNSIEGERLIQFGIDNNENFCQCNSKSIRSNFYTIKKINYNNNNNNNNNNIYIGKDYKKNIVKVIL